jgi:hypothetical protein
MAAFVVREEDLPCVGGPVEVQLAILRVGIRIEGVVHPAAPPVGDAEQVQHRFGQWIPGLEIGLGVEAGLDLVGGCDLEEGDLAI